jgi:hypothetical protein
MRPNVPGQTSCAAAAEVAAKVASEFALKNAVPPGQEQSVLTDGSVELASYRATGALSPPVEGSRHTVYLTVFARDGCRGVDFSTIDYDQGEETEYVRRLQARLIDLLRRAEPDAEFTSRGGSVRTLPP